MDAVEARRIPKGGVEQVAPNYVDGKRERAPAKGEKDSGIPPQPAGGTQLDGRSEGVKDSDISTRSLGKAHGAVVKGTLDIEKGKRERGTAIGAMDSDHPFQLLGARGGSASLRTSETVTGTRERAPVEGVMGSDILAQSADKRCRSGDLHLASVAGKEVVKWHSDMKEKIETHTRKDPGASCISDGGGPVLSAWVAEACNRGLGQELTEEGERLHADLVWKARERGLDAWTSSRSPRL